MANMIDSIPNYHGEAKTWKALKEQMPENCYVYHNREIKGREFDFCLVWEDHCIVVIEVKGWLADKIKVNGKDSIWVEGYQNLQPSPASQARGYRFDIKDRIEKKYNACPWVTSMVCYPFITRTEYEVTRLNIICDPEFVLFKEDLENPGATLKKIRDLYQNRNIQKIVPLNKEFVLKIRSMWEPNIVVGPTEEVYDAPYSKLCIFPDGSIKRRDIKSLIQDYFSGTKCIVFVDDQEDCNDLIDDLNDALEKRNIQPKGNNLTLGYTTGLKSGRGLVRAFNFEIYVIEDLADIVENKVVIEEGVYTPEQAEILKKLVSKSSFNFEQYCVEHASITANTMVEAGAGTGKTFSMVSRVAFLCNRKNSTIQSVENDIALVTFTNDAADNMKVRLKQMFLNYYILTNNPRHLGFTEDIDRAHISTIHSFAIEILRGASMYTGLGTNYTITENQYRREQLYNTYLSAFIEKKEDENPNYLSEIPVPLFDLRKKLMELANRLLSKSVDIKDIQPSEMGVVNGDQLAFFNESQVQICV